jgi:2-polyprenyl-3-methyl-5-hydroxy-6-metoxy-1,4-benzoquinol methylase
MVFSISTLSAQKIFHQPTAREILNTTGLKGGLIVHLGCGNGELTSALHINDRYLVHGLDTNPHAIIQARKHIQGLGLYGQVSVCKLDGRDLP